MKVQYFSRKLQEIVAGVTLILIIGSFEILGRGFQIQQVSAVEAGPLANGIYLYGEDPWPNQIGKGYVIFSYQNGKVVGAFYYPDSEFDCFAGSLRDHTLDVKSLGADDLEIVAVKVNLADLHPIQTISSSDQRILAVCKQERAKFFSQQLVRFLSSLLRLEKPKSDLDVLPVSL